nr:MAG TPA: hypothetical protein [Caudoviricetes sp.]
MRIEKYDHKLDKIVHTLDTDTLQKLATLANAIEFCKVDDSGSTHVKFKNNVLLEANGHIVTYTDKGCIVNKAEMIHLNPMLDSDEGKKQIKLIEDCKIEA